MLNLKAKELNYLLSLDDSVFGSYYSVNSFSLKLA